MMTENSNNGTFQLNTTTTPADSGNHQSITSNSHDHHNISTSAIHQHQQVVIKSGSDYEYVDESGAPIIAHNYSLNHHNNDDHQQQQQQQQTMLNSNEQQQHQQQQHQSQVHTITTTSSQYHVSGGGNSTTGSTTTGGVGGGGGGGGGGGSTTAVSSNISSVGNISSGNGVLNTSGNSSSQNQQRLSISPPRQHQQHHPPPPPPPVSRVHHHQQRQTSSPTWHPTPPSSQVIHHPIQQQQPQPPPPPSNQPQQQQQQQQQQSGTDRHHPANAFGMLRHGSDILYITEPLVEIGRNSSTSSVHYHVAKNSFVSRKHFEVLHDLQTSEFYLVCLSKNGVFIDDVFQRKSAEAIKLPKSCTFRFPSTEIRIAFESFIEKSHEANKYNKSEENSNVIYSPLKITIPKTEQKSPFPSPTGTISAANSCPTSPRQGFPDYNAYNYNNNNNFQNDLFPPPSTSTYNEYEKPPYSYAQLIVQSISASPDKQLTLSGIYSFISKHYPYYRKEANKGWQNSIRHNLSLNRYFIKVARSQDEPGKGSFWRIDPNSEAKLIDQSYKKRRQRGSQCFRPSYGMPRSAPVSPSHIDNSRENSPLHDIVLQSAPGSPGVSYQNNNHTDNNHSGGDGDINSYNSQNLVQQSSYNSHNQYNNNSSNFYHTTTLANSASSTITATSSSALGGGSSSLKRSNPSSIPNSGASTGMSSSLLSSGGGGTSDLYDDMQDYSGGGDSDDCGGGGGGGGGGSNETVKRQKKLIINN